MFILHEQILNILEQLQCDQLDIHNAQYDLEKVFEKYMQEQQSQPNYLRNEHC